MQIAVVLYPGMTALDAIGPYQVLGFAPGVEMRLVSHAPGPVVTDDEVLVLGATHSFADTPAPDIVLVPGGETGTEPAMRDSDLIAWLRQVHRTSRWTTSVCSGSLILAAAGILAGQPATTHWMVQSTLAELGALPQPDKRIVHTGRIATAAGVSAGIDLALWLVGEVWGRERAEIIQLYIEYDPQPPFTAGHPSTATERVRELARTEAADRTRRARPVGGAPAVWPATSR
ncbi:DJ-1/PfpI family protein [Goodfellowiella coeruleoviolacea]|uniref:DJ-1/PfpI family protein n=1 Tax=Goodfellowiella coeruleoviolacea TaxID=334858 RepID=A0AAE3G9F0_9PSEU|nr:DJ-1/PfpI family protein [Goodfellowiella coeruleoviolacea]MCP2164111.1 DJ-1/PfpI family protein [Goodfellowiella coeruleoviolacea]